MKNKITKGEWIFSEYFSGDIGVYSEGGDGYDIALVRRRNGQAKANARLIAAAPDLLKALRLLLDNAEIDALNETKDDNPGLYEGIQLAREAIFKATEEL